MTNPIYSRPWKKKIGITGLDFHIAATASNGVECLEILHRLQPDLLICDIRMPGLTGLDLMEKTSERRAAQPRSFLSAVIPSLSMPAGHWNWGPWGTCSNRSGRRLLKETLEKAMTRLCRN